MNKLLTFLVLVCLVACKDKETINSSPGESKWKVIKTTLEFIDGSNEVHTGTTMATFSITLKKDNTFFQEFSPYYVSSNGTWTYSTADKNLQLFYENGDPFIKYDVLMWNARRLRLYQAHGLEGRGGPVKVTTELIRFW